MNLNQTKSVVLALTLLIMPFANAEEQKAPVNPFAIPGMTPAMGNSMNPAVMANMMGMMMNPAGMMTNPMATCASCHSGDEVARYGKTMGPMMAMMNPMNWMNPAAYMGMMTPMMDPATYTEWFNAMMKKGGAAMPGTTGQSQ